MTTNARYLLFSTGGCGPARVARELQMRCFSLNREMLPETVLGARVLSHHCCSVVCCFQQFIQGAGVVKVQRKISWRRWAGHSGRLFHDGIASLRTHYAHSGLSLCVCGHSFLSFGTYGIKVG